MYEINNKCERASRARQWIVLFASLLIIKDLAQDLIYHCSYIMCSLCFWENRITEHNVCYSNNDGNTAVADAYDNDDEDDDDDDDKNNNYNNNNNNNTKM